MSVIYNSQSPLLQPSLLVPGKKPPLGTPLAIDDRNPLSKKLAHYFLFNEFGGGNKLFDRVGGATADYEGSADVNASWHEIDGEKALLFNNTRWHQINNMNMNLHNGGPVTVLTRMYPTTDSIVSGLFGGSSGGDDFHVILFNNGFAFWDYGDTGGNGRISVSYSPYVNTWLDAAFVSEGIGGSFKGIYWNGKLAASGTSSDGPSPEITDFNIGWDNIASSKYNGYMSYFVIYHRVLTPIEIATFQSDPFQVWRPA